MPVLTRYPSSVVAAGTWVNGSNAYADDTSYATNPNSSKNSDEALDLGGFDFSALPSDATINSVTIRCREYVSATSTMTTKVQPWDGATGINTQQTHTPPTGSANEADWDTTWSPTAAQLKSANLFVRYVTRRGGNTASTTYLDFIYISVDYSPAPQSVETPALDASVSLNAPALTAGAVSLTTAALVLTASLFASDVSTGSQATGDILSCAISATGWEAQITIKGRGTGGDYRMDASDTSDFGNLTDPDTAKVKFTVVSEGYDASGSPTRKTRYVYGTRARMKAYPNHANAEEDTTTSPGNVIVTLALSDYIYDDDKNGGAGTSGTDPTVTILEGFYRSADGVTAWNNAATDFAVTNNSTQDYPRVIGRWAIVPHQVVRAATFDLEAVAFHRFAENGKPVACVKFGDGVTADQYSTEMVKSSAADACPVYRRQLTLSNYTDNVLVTCNFTAYPWVGDADSVLTSVGGAGGLVLGPLTFVADPDSDYLNSYCAVVDPAMADESAGVAYANNDYATANSHKFKTIRAAAAAIATAQGGDGSGGMVYLVEATHTTTGTSGTCNCTNGWITVTRYPGSVKANVVLAPSGSSWAGPTKLRFYDISIAPVSASYIGGGSGRIVWTDACAVAAATQVNPSSMGLIGEHTLGYSTFTTSDKLSYPPWLNASTGNLYALIRGCTATNAKYGVSTVGYGPSCVLTTSVTKGSGLDGIWGTVDRTNVVIAYNKNLADACTSSQFGAMANLGAVNLAVVCNVWEQITNDLPPTMVYGDGNQTPSHNVLLWHNTVAGARSNIGYNDVVDVSTARSNFSLCHNALYRICTKHDVFVGALGGSGLEIGAWSVDYGVGWRGNHSEYADNNTFLPRYWGLKGTVAADALYTEDKSLTTDGSGGGTYTPQAASPLRGKIATAADVLIPYDIDGNAYLPGGSAGAYNVGGAVTVTGAFLDSTAALYNPVVSPVQSLAAPSLGVGEVLETGTAQGFAPASNSHQDLPITIPADCTFIVLAMAQASSVTITSATIDGTSDSFTRLATTGYSGGVNGKTEVWTLANPSVTGAQTISVDLTGSQYNAYIVAYFKNTTSVRAYDTQIGVVPYANAQTITTDAFDAQPGDLALLAAFEYAVSTPLVVTNGGQSEIAHQQSPTTYAVCWVAKKAITSGPTTTMTVTEGASDYAALVAFSLASTGGPTTTLFAPEVALGSSTQSVTGASIGSTVALTTPSVTTGAVAVSLPLIGSTASPNAPTAVAPTYALTTPSISTTVAVNVPTVVPEQAVTTPLISGGTAVNVPTVAPGPRAVTTPALALTPALTPPSLAVQPVTLAPPAIGSTLAFYPPTTIVAGTGAAPPCIDSTVALGAPTVAAGAVAVAPPALGSTASLNPPTVAQRLAVATIPAGTALTPPTVAVGALSAAPPAITLTPVLSPPTVAVQPVAVSLPAIPAGAVLTGPALALRVTTPTISTTQALSAPTVAQSVAPPLRASSAVLTPPSVSTGPVALGTPTIPSGAALTAPGVGLAVFPPALASSLAIYAPTVRQAVLASTISVGSQVFAPGVAPAPVAVGLPTISASAQVFAPQDTSSGFVWVLREIGYWLQGLGHGTVGVDLFLGETPALPINAITLYEERGRIGQEGFDGTQWEIATVGIALRNSNYATGRMKIERIYRALLGVANQRLGPTFYQRIDLLTSPYWDGNDENGNPVFVVDIACAKALSPLV